MPEKSAFEQLDLPDANLRRSSFSRNYDVEFGSLSPTDSSLEKWRDSIELRGIPLWPKSRSVRLDQLMPIYLRKLRRQIGF